MRLDAAACSAIDSTGQFAESLDLADAPARRAVARRLGQPRARSTRTAGSIVAGMGGSSVGGRLAAGALGPRLRRPLALAMGYDIPPWIGEETLVLCSSYSGSTEETVATYDAARAAGAPRIVATTGGPLAERAREDGVPVVPLPGGFQPRAAVGLLARHRARGRRAVRRRAVAARRDRGRRRARRRAGARVGPGRRRRRRRQADRPRAARLDPGHHRRGPHRLGRLPLEVPDQREREAARVLRQAARARPQRDRRLGRRRGPAGRRLPRRPVRRRACGAADRRHGRDRRRRRRRSSSG